MFYSLQSAVMRFGFRVREPEADGRGSGPRLFDEVCRVLRVKHYSMRTEVVYLGWIRRFILVNGRRHPRAMGAPEAERFLSSLAVDGQVAASTQNQALSALLFLYKEVLGIELPWMEDVTRAKRPRRLPTVLSRGEVQDLLAAARWAAVAVVQPAVRHRAAVDGVPAPASEGRRFRAQ